ncbi:MAG TPA: hypothetical protein VK923_01545 [Euzebyales bacterium]|nr:hypothetical protein [Euzebyales bacterium]
MRDSLDVSGFTSAPMPWDGMLAAPWLLRMKAVRVLLDHGYHVLHTDADAVGIGGRMPEIEALDDCDLVAIQDAVGPPDALATMGVVVSAGCPPGSSWCRRRDCGLTGDTPWRSCARAHPTTGRRSTAPWSCRASLGSVGPSGAPDVPISGGGLRLVTASDFAIAVE